LLTEILDGIDREQVRNIRCGGATFDGCLVLVSCVLFLVRFLSSSYQYHYYYYYYNNNCYHYDTLVEPIRRTRCNCEVRSGCGIRIEATIVRPGRSEHRRARQVR
jgi:hypothetical protein